MKKTRYLIIVVFILAAGAWVGYRLYQQHILKEIISRLQADSRVAQVLVTAVNYDETTKKTMTTIKFLEFDTQGRPLEPKYFTFPGNIIQFQSLVVRFEDRFVEAGDLLKGKSVYLFWKAFYLEGAQTKEFPITDAQEVPGGYKINTKANVFENRFWGEFWRYAFNKQMASQNGIKNVQIEAPGGMFIPGFLYTIKIEHDGGLRIDTQALPHILKGEKIPT